jgi:hypothetical protein
MVANAYLSWKQSYTIRKSWEVFPTLGRSNLLRVESCHTQKFNRVCIRRKVRDNSRSEQINLASVKSEKESNFIALR